MNKACLFLSIAALLAMQACSTEEETSPCENRTFGSLYKDGNKFACPFTLQRRAADRSFIDIENRIIILDSMVGEYYPVTEWNAPYMYKVKMDVPKNYFTEEQYTVSLRALDKNRKPCGEPKEFAFYKNAEKADSAEYSTRLFIDTTYTYTYNIPSLATDYTGAATVIYKDTTIVINGAWHEKFLFFGLKEMPSHDWYHVLKVCADMKFHLTGEIKE
jgi:hypothetical protein